MQVFDGITAAVFSVMMPLIVADVAFGSGHFNLAQGIVGTATGIGASLSTVLAGYVSDKFGSSVAFTGLAGVAATGPRHDLARDAGDAAQPAGTGQGLIRKTPAQAAGVRMGFKGRGLLAHASMLRRRWRLRSTIWRAPENPRTPCAWSCESARETVSSVRPR